MSSQNLKVISKARYWLGWSDKASPDFSFPAAHGAATQINKDMAFYLVAFCHPYGLLHPVSCNKSILESKNAVTMPKSSPLKRKKKNQGDYLAPFPTKAVRPKKNKSVPVPHTLEGDTHITLEKWS